MKFQYDIFFLFSETEASKEKKWIKNLSHFLHLLLQRKLGREPAILHTDQIAQVAEKENQTAQEIFRKTAAFVLIVPNEPQPAFDEHLTQIIAACQQSERHPFAKRLFKVLKSETATTHQQSLHRIPSYSFFENGQEREKLLLYQDLDEAEADRFFWVQVVDLAFDLYMLLYQLKHGQAPLFSGKTVLVCETGFDQKKNRDLIARELKRYGHKILPELLLPDTPDQFKQELLNHLKQASLVLHILGADSGRKLKDSELYTAEYQLRISNEFVDSPQGQNINRIIWIPPQLKIASQKQQIYLERIKRNLSEHQKTELVEIPQENLKSIIHDRLQSSEKQKIEIENRTNQTQKPSLYLIFPKSDEQKAKPLISFLEQNQTHVSTPLYTGSQIQILSRHRQQLVQTSCVIVFSTQQNMFWVISKLKDLLKAPGFGRKKDFNHKVLLVPQPEKLPKNLIENQKITIFEYNEQFAPEQLSFLTEKRAENSKQ